MPIPRKCKIKDAVYAIKRLPKADRETLRGWCDTKAKAIYINLDDKEVDKASTLYHEVLHAILHEYKINFRKDRRWFKEASVTAMEEAKMQVFRENPKVTQYVWPHVTP